jgi:hypothetical protein
MKTRKITAVLIILIIMIILTLSAGLLLACASDEPGGGDNNPAADSAAAGDPADTGEGGQSDAGPVDKWAQIPHNLPEANFNGRVFTVISGEVTDANRMYDRFSAEVQTGEPINDALYTRRINIEERYGISINNVQNGSPADTARRSILAGDGAYDLITDTINNVRNLAAQRHLTDLFETPFIRDNLNNSWWDQAMIRDLSINGKLFFQAGHIVLRDKLRLSCMFFNKDMAQSLGIEHPYQYVREGTWTVDKLMEITRGINRDLTGDGTMGQYDQWGFTAQHEFALHIFAGAGEKMIGVNRDGVPELTINTPRALDVIQKALAVCIEPEAMFHADTIRGYSDIWVQMSAFFQENRFFIRATLLEPVVRDLRAMPTDFGILPTVKFDDAQENYYTYVEFNGLCVSIPMNADLEFAGFITEALAYESGTVLMPAFYDLCLTSKVLRDDESEEMLDIIFNNKVYDIGYIYRIGDISYIFNDLVSAGSADFASRFERRQGAIETALERFIESYDQE